MATVDFIENQVAMDNNTDPNTTYENTIFGAVVMIIFALFGVGAVYLWGKSFYRKFEKMKYILEHEGEL